MQDLQPRSYNHLTPIEKKMWSMLPQDQRPLLLQNSLPRLAEETQDPVIALVAWKTLFRSKVGMQKYGTPVSRTDLSLNQWLVHSQEELLDAANYNQRLQQAFGTLDRLLITANLSEEALSDAQVGRLTRAMLLSLQSDLYGMPASPAEQPSSSADLITWSATPSPDKTPVQAAELTHSISPQQLTFASAETRSSRSRIPAQSPGATPIEHLCLRCWRDGVEREATHFCQDVAQFYCADHMHHDCCQLIKQPIEKPGQTDDDRLIREGMANYLADKGSGVLPQHWMRITSPTCPKTGRYHFLNREPMDRTSTCIDCGQLITDRALRDMPELAAVAKANITTGYSNDDPRFS